MNKEKQGYGPGYLTLESGEVFAGTLYGALQDGFGEVVFHTGMTGYQEVMSDPSFSGQIVTFTYPLIGNYGINDIDFEAAKPALAGMVISELCLEPSHYLAGRTLAEAAEAYGFPILAGVDTRTITKRVRQEGPLWGIISDRPLTSEEFAARDRKHLKKSLVADVSCREVQHYPGPHEHVVLVDLGMKRSILNALLAQGCRVTVVPFDTTYEQIQALQPDGLLFSNGPGDPEDLRSYCTEWRKAAEAFPTMGICLGHQVLALAFGGKTEKLKYGHRGGNHPVKELLTGKVYMTSQNHGYVVKEESLDSRLLAVTYRNVNDGSVEGLRHQTKPVMTVQFHPEAHPGPSDTSHLFEQFLQLMRTEGAKTYA
ncbi:carbamoyl phosphate synthase small subunit [Brevibacillus composti]|uniref:Carbamoyl phosphate synthase small chain n=1 Tax=Brevibacillus composti TaxID=2796470 RepID=A0A7T5JND9_9BACL|nr:carbamoyl phosphate synthase small subunit [Brevibacillus composti]QQE74084.1 carbamoyl phosphate synthase small subunit [Brevibacillus composti]QUO41168.1 carbamoyl phosphate synthase small subunit [Brevibacillus composti]